MSIEPAPMMESAMKFARALALATLVTGIPALALAGSYEIGDIVITDPHARATAPGAPTGAGYMTITNNGSAPDRLLAGSAPFADKAQIHEMRMDGNIMRMREVEGGLEIPAGGTVELRPGGFHIMFMGLRQTLAEGQRWAATLSFESAGTGDIELEVRKIGAGHMQRKAPAR